jgi:iduronate 2-sulfatase
MMRPVVLGLIFLLVASGFSAVLPVNVLFIAVDDLRPALGCYGDPSAKTPHIDRLAERSVVFRRAYCQQAVCNPSRASLITGLRPDTIRVWDLKAHFRDTIADAVTLPQHFERHGYTTVSIGKILHGSGAPAKDPKSWSVPPRFDVVRERSLRYALPENLKGRGLKGVASEAANVPDSHYVDGQVCAAAAEAIEELAENERPFFLAVGFRKPHLPFCAPQRYWDLHDPARIPAPEPGSPPEGAPELAVRSWMELEGYTDIPESGRISPKMVRRLRHGYQACVSYIDALIGRLLDRLEERGLTGSTVVCLWGDHGFHLGEQGLWTKASNYELATRSPLIVCAPMVSRVGGHCDALVELVDVYPTLAEVCGLPVPEGLEGTSFVPLLETPDLRWKSAVFSQFPRSRNEARHRADGDIMGRAIRTKSDRYVEWTDSRSGAVVAMELYHYPVDPLEQLNLAKDPAYRARVQSLARRLQEGWRKATPAHP